MVILISFFSLSNISLTVFRTSGMVNVQPTYSGGTVRGSHFKSLYLHLLCGQHNHMHLHTDAQTGKIVCMVEMPVP